MITLPVCCLTVILWYLRYMRAEQILITAIISTTHCTRVRPHDLPALAHKVAVVLQGVDMLSEGKKLAAPANPINFPLVAEILAILGRGKIERYDVDIGTSPRVTNKTELTVQSSM